MDTLTDGGSRRASARGVEVRARASIRSQASGVVGAALSGLLWQAGAVAAPLMVKYAIDRGVLTKDRPRAAHLARRAAGGRALGDDRRRRAAPLRDPEPGAVGCARPRRDLRALTASRRELPRSRRARRADVARVLRLGARCADDGLDRAHDRLRADGVRGRRRATRPRLAARVDRADPAAPDLRSRAGRTRGATTCVRNACRSVGARLRRWWRRR